MDSAEIVECLQQIRSQPCFSNLRYVSQDLLEAAIALLTPEPVTEDGLRAEGFKRHDTPFGDNWVLRVQDDLDITFFQRRWVLAEFEGGEYDLHIESMQQLREVIKALRGNESEGL